MKNIDRMLTPTLSPYTYLNSEPVLKNLLADLQRSGQQVFIYSVLEL